MPMPQPTAAPKGVDPIPGHALLAAAQTLRIAQSDGSAEPMPWEAIPQSRKDHWLEQARRVVEAAFASIDPTFLVPHHVLLIRRDRWTLQHPLVCRPRLGECATHALVAAVYEDELSWVSEGDWPVHVHPDGCITVGDNPAGDPHHAGGVRSPA